MCIMSVKCPI